MEKHETATPVRSTSVRVSATGLERRRKGGGEVRVLHGGERGSYRPPGAAEDRAAGALPPSCIGGGRKMMAIL
jgi:hypothetical protein